MPWTDWINGLFELVAGAAFYLNVRQIQRDRAVRGVHWGQLAFSTVWGLWNLPFYWALDQKLSLVGAVGLAVINVWYLALVVKFWGRDFPLDEEEPPLYVGS